MTSAPLLALTLAAFVAVPPPKQRAEPFTTPTPLRVPRFRVADDDLPDDDDAPAFVPPSEVSDAASVEPTRKPQPLTEADRGALSLAESKRARKAARRLEEARRARR